MNSKILLTSFATWLPHQKSNSSDDLLIEIAKLESSSLTFLKQLPVDVPKASRLVIAKIAELQPDSIICCGMAESRTKLTVESCATCGNAFIKTPVNLEKLVVGADGIEISHDAGKFVCEGLYYEVLKYLQEHNLNTPCIFVHVPVLTEENSPEVVRVFWEVIQRMASLVSLF